MPISVTKHEASQTSFGTWLKEERTRRGLTLDHVANGAETSQPVISNLERGTRNPSREMVKRVVSGLLQDETDEYVFRVLHNKGLQAAGFTPLSEKVDEHEVIDYLRGQPPTMQDKAMKILKAAFDEEDTKDNTGNVGK